MSANLEGKQMLEIAAANYHLWRYWMDVLADRIRGPGCGEAFRPPLLQQMAFVGLNSNALIMLMAIASIIYDDERRSQLWLDTYDRAVCRVLAHLCRCQTSTHYEALVTYAKIKPSAQRHPLLPVLTGDQPYDHFSTPEYWESLVRDYVASELDCPLPDRFLGPAQGAHDAEGQRTTDGQSETPRGKTRRISAHRLANVPYGRLFDDRHHVGEGLEAAMGSSTLLGTKGTNAMIPSVGMMQQLATKMASLPANEVMTGETGFDLTYVAERLNVGTLKKERTSDDTLDRFGRVVGTTVDVPLVRSGTYRACEHGFWNSPTMTHTGFEK